LPAKETVIAGDALVTYNPYTGSSGPQLVARAATANSEQALASLNRLRDTGARLLPSGHGPVWAAGVEEAVQQAFAAGLS
jgi:glyoxylase-like metal-dependent hydrolase (beta-lactamase superfamily II)